MIKENQATEYFKIRKHLLNTIFRSGPVPVRLASSRELSREFGVTHMTVARVMKDLANDGYLEIRRGVGTFTNAKNNNVIENSRVYGIVIGDGKYSFFDRLELMLFSAFSDAVLCHSQSNWVQNCNLLGPLESADEELMRNNLDGVVWITPAQAALPAIRRLRERGMPVVCVGKRLEPVNSFYIDYAELGRRVAEMMLEQERRRILLVLLENSLDDQEKAAAGFREAYRQAGEEFDPAWIITGTAEEQKNFGRVLAFAKPDGIIFFDSLRPYLPALEAHPEITFRCALYTQEWELRNDMGYAGSFGHMELREATATAAAVLAASPAEPVYHPIPFRIVFPDGDAKRKNELLSRSKEEI